LEQRFEVKEKCHGPRRVRLYDLSRPCRGGRGSKADIKKLHAYDVPAISVIPIENVDRDYLNWLMDETKPA
jgi:hypothetical protein